MRQPAVHGLMWLGKMDMAPPPVSSALTIFLCSTKTDMEWERRKVWEDVLWELQEDLRARGMTVTLVDMYLGAHLDPVHDRHTFHDYLNEKRYAHRNSAGPLFVFLIGDKYGPAPLPSKLTEEEFEFTKAETFTAGKDVKVLQEWYVLDDNAIPPMYILQPITAKYKNYANRDDCGRCDAENWDRDYQQLQEILQTSWQKLQAPNLAHGGGTQMGSPFISGLEEQIQLALNLDVERVFVVKRTLQDVDPMSPELDKYVNVSSKTQSLSKEKYESLRRQCAHFESRLNEKNMSHFMVPWGPAGFDPIKYEEHAQYLEQMRNVLVSWVTRCVDTILDGQALTVPIVVDEDERKLKEEVDAHMTFCGSLLNKQLCGLDEVEEQLNRLIRQNMTEGHQLLAIHGPEGTGKTSLLIRWLRRARSLFGSDCVVIYRFVGLTISSSSPDELLRSLCEQLNLLLRRNDRVKSLAADQLVGYFFDILDEMAGMTQQYVFVIDGLERLRAPVEGSEVHFWEGIAAMFPPNVHFVVSFTTSPTNLHLFNRLTNQVSFETHLISMPTLTTEQLTQIIHNTLDKHNRRLTDEQLTILKRTIQPRSTPLYVQLLMQEALSWTSTKVLNGASGLPCSLDVAILNRFEELESRYGDELLSTISRYISSSHCGLTELELLDLLSCNNDILLGLYPEVLPAVIRFPHAHWMRIRNDMGMLLEYRQVGRETLLRWAHTTIANTAISRYFTNSEEIKRSHQDIADMFLNTWVGNKPMVVPSRRLQIIDTGCRYVTQQPLIFSETLYNNRRLDELWYQLLHAGNVDKFKELSVCNFEYLLARVHSSSAHSLVTDFKTTCCQVIDGEIQLVLQCLLLGLETISDDPLQLASLLIGRLRQLKEHFPDHIDSLVQQCMEWCDSFNLPLIVPLSSWLPDPRIPLVQTIEDPDDITVLCSTKNSQHVFCATNRSEIKMYHIPSKKLIKTLKGHQARITCLKMSTSNRFLLSGSVDCSVRIWHVAKGKPAQVIREHKDPVTCLTLTSNDDLIITGSHDHKVRVISMATGDVLHVLSDHTGSIVSVILNSNDTILATGSADKQVRIWDMDDMTLLYVIDDDIPSPIISMGLTLDNTFLLIGCEDGSLRVKSFTTGSSIHTLEGHVGKVESMALSTDCYHAAVGCTDGSLYVYNLRTTELLDGYSGHEHPITSVHCSSNQHFVFTAAKDKINVWTFYRRHTHTIHTDEHTSTVTCVNVSRDGKSAITGARDKKARLWILTGDPNQCATDNNDVISPAVTPDITMVKHVIHAPRGRQGSVQSNEDVKSILSAPGSRRGSSNSRVQWDHPVSRHPQPEWGKPPEEVREVEPEEWSQDSTRTLRQDIPGRRASLAQHHASDMRELGEMDDNDDDVVNNMTSVYGAEAPRIKCSLPERRSSTWRESTGSLDPFAAGSILRRQSHLAGWESRAAAATSAVVQEVDYIKQEEEVPVPEEKGGSDQVVKLWNLDICDFSADLVGHTGPVTAVALADDEAFAVSGSEDKTVKVWSIMLGCIITDFEEHNSTITAIEVLSDNARVLSVEADGFIKLWSAESGETTMCLSGPTGLLKLSPNSQYAVSGEYDNTMKIWSVSDGSVVQDIAHNKAVTCVAYSPDSQFVVTGSEDMSLKVWEVVTGKLTQVLVEHENVVSCVAITDNNKYIISGSHDHHLLIWCLETGSVEHRLQGHTDHVTVVKVTHDGTVAVSGSMDGTLRVWSVAYGRIITTFNLHRSVSDLHLTDKASHLVVRVKDSLHVPLLCLHNSPAGEVKSQSQVSLRLSGGYPILPLKPQPSLNQTNISVFPVPKKNSSTDKRPSISSIPEIIKVSPMRVPISTAVKVQEKNRESRKAATSTKALSTAETSTGVTRPQTEESPKRSGICVIL